MTVRCPYDRRKVYVKPVLHQSHSSRTPLYDGTILISCVALWYHRVTRLSATTKLIFIHINFPCDSLAILCGRNIAVMHGRLLQNTQGVRTTNVRALTHLFRPQMPQDCRAITVQLTCASLHGCRKNATNHTTAYRKFARLSRCRTCDSLAMLQAHLARALRVNARQSCEQSTAVLRLVKI